MSKTDIKPFKDLMIAVPSKNHTRKECQDYLINHHAHTALSAAAIDKVFLRFTMNAILTKHECDIPTLYEKRDDAHLVIEHVTTSRNNYLAAVEDSEYLKIVRPDETYMLTEFMEHLPDFYSCAEDIIFSNGTKNSKYRIFDLLKRAENVTIEEFCRCLDKEGEKLANNTAYRNVVHKRIHNYVLNIPPFFGYMGTYDAIVETFVDDPSVLPAFYPQIQEYESIFSDAKANQTIVTLQHVFR